MATQASSSGVSEAQQMDLRGVPAIIRWTDSEPRCLGTSLASTPVSLDAEFDPSTRAASFRLCIALFRRHSDKPIPVYLLIKPGQIQSILHSRPAGTPGEVEAPRSDMVCMLFQLNSPAALVMPPDPLRLNDKAQAAILKLVRSVARQTTLSICIGNSILSISQVAVICGATYRDFKLSSRHANISGLYGGKGGKIIRVDDVLAESPPSYDELGAPPPMPPIPYEEASSSKKRRLTSPDTRDFNLSIVENICKKICAEQYEKLCVELAESETRITDRLDSRLNERFSSLEEACQTRLKRLEDQLQEVRDEVTRLDEARRKDVERLEDRIQEISDDVDGRIDLEVEDRVLGIKIDLEGFVKDELKNTEDALKERLAEASLSLQFNE